MGKKWKEMEGIGETFNLAHAKDKGVDQQLIRLQGWGSNLGMYAHYVRRGGNVRTLITDGGGQVDVVAQMQAQRGLKAWRAETLKELMFPTELLSPKRANRNWWTKGQNNLFYAMAYTQWAKDAKGQKLHKNSYTLFAAHRAKAGSGFVEENMSVSVARKFFVAKWNNIVKSIPLWALKFVRRYPHGYRLPMLQVLFHGGEEMIPHLKHNTMMILDLHAYLKSRSRKVSQLKLITKIGLKKAYMRILKIKTSDWKIIAGLYLGNNKLGLEGQLSIPKGDDLLRRKKTVWIASFWHEESGREVVKLYDTAGDRQSDGFAQIWRDLIGKGYEMQRLSQSTTYKRKNHRAMRGDKYPTKISAHRVGIAKVISVLRCKTGGKLSADIKWILAEEMCGGPEKGEMRDMYRVPSRQKVLIKLLANHCKKTYGTEADKEITNKYSTALWHHLHKVADTLKMYDYCKGQGVDYELEGSHVENFVRLNHDRLSALQRRLQLIAEEKELDIEFASKTRLHALPSSNSTTFLDTKRKVIGEGKDMNHCIGSYSSNAYNGECSVYSVNLNGLRATMMLKNHGFYQVYGPSNKSISNAMKTELLKYFKEIQNNLEVSKEKRAYAGECLKSAWLVHTGSYEMGGLEQDIDIS